MSRGPGRVQRAILNYLATDPAGYIAGGAPDSVTVSAVAAVIFGTYRPTDAQRSSVRRAVRQLAAAGLVKADRESTFCTDYERTYRQYRHGKSPSSYCQMGAPYHDVTISETWVCRAWTAEESKRYAREVKQQYGISVRSPSSVTSSERLAGPRYDHGQDASCHRLPGPAPRRTARAGRADARARRPGRAAAAEAPAQDGGGPQPQNVPAHKRRGSTEGVIR
jgi:hypothetical protein